MHSVHDAALNLCCLNDSSVRRDKGVLFSLIGLAIIMLRGTNPDNEGVVSFTTRDGCVGDL